MRLSLRAGALLVAGSIAVHELRYVAGYGDPAGVSGHGYMAYVAPLVALALAFACGTWVARVGRAAAPAMRGPRTWAGASAALRCLRLSGDRRGARGRRPPRRDRAWRLGRAAARGRRGGLIALTLCGARAAASAARSLAPLRAACPPAPVDFALPARAPRALS